MTTATDGYIEANNVDVFQAADLPSVVWTLLDADGDPVSLIQSSGFGGPVLLQVDLYVYRRGTTDVGRDPLLPAFYALKKTTVNPPADLSISGSPTYHIVTMTYTDADLPVPGVYEYRMFTTNTQTLVVAIVARGTMNVLAADGGA
jgi:hypothetical protein